jgi:hypothetical protein
LADQLSSAPRHLSAQEGLALKERRKPCSLLLAKAHSMKRLGVMTGTYIGERVHIRRRRQERDSDELHAGKGERRKGGMDPDR